MKRSEIYREAAKRMENGKYCFSCFAVAIVAGESSNGSAVKFYERWFKQRGSGSAWMVDFPGHEPEDMASARDRRVLSLCFMAAIAEDEERSRKRRTQRHDLRS